MNHKARAIACELIAQQTNDLADKITGYFEEIYKCRTQREAQDSKACAAIVDFLKKRVGVKIKLIFNTSNPPMCMPLMANVRHVLSTIMIDDAYNEQTNQFLNAIKKSTVKKGVVDLKNGKLGGVYSEIENPVWMSFHYCTQNFTPRECTAILMHEIGHLFLAFEMMYRTIRASQILAALHQVRTGNDTSLTYEHALSLAGSTLADDPKEFIECVTMHDNTAVCSVVFARVYHKLANDFGDNAVAGVNFEALSDNFAAKWGLAEDLATGLYTIYGSGELGRNNPFTGLLLYLSPILSSVIVGAYIGAALSAATVGIGVAVVLTAMCIFVSGRGDNFGQQTNVYDKPYVRFQRIRETLVAQMKSLELDSVTRERLLKEIATIDQVISGGKEMKDVFDDIAGIFTSNRRASFAFRLERDIELLAHNDLFVNAQRLASKA